MQPPEEALGDVGIEEAGGQMFVERACRARSRKAVVELGPRRPMIRRPSGNSPSERARTATAAACAGRDRRSRRT